MPWSADEIKVLTAIYPKAGPQGVLKALPHRSYKSCVDRAWWQGLRAPERPQDVGPRDPVALKRLRELIAAGHSLSQAAKRLRKTRGQVSGLVHRHIRKRAPKPLLQEPWRPGDPKPVSFHA